MVDGSQRTGAELILFHTSQECIGRDGKKEPDELTVIESPIRPHGVGALTEYKYNVNEKENGHIGSEVKDLRQAIENDDQRINIFCWLW